MKVQAPITNFTGGEVSPRLNGRPEVSKVKNGCRHIINGLVRVHGGIVKRSGSRFVVAQASGYEDVRVVPYQYNTEQSYMLLFGPGYIWFLRDQGIITENSRSITGITQANPAVVTCAGHPYSNGDRIIIAGAGGMTELNNRQFTVANAATNTFELSGVNSSSYAAFTSGGTAARVVQVTTTYAEDELFDLQFVNITDTLYIVHKNHPMRKLARFSHTSWVLSEPTITTGPFRSFNTDRSLTLTPSSFSASATAYGTYVVGTTFTLTASSAVFDAGHVGGLFRLYEEGNATGIANAPIGDSTKTINSGDVYTNAGNVYGVAALSAVGTSTWANFTRVPDHDAGRVRVYSGITSGDGFRYIDSDFLHPGYCVVRITAVASSTSATAELVRYQLPESIVSAGTTYWQEGAWNDYRGYPRAVTIFEQRLFFGGSDGDPTVLWSSRSGAYEDFTDGPDANDALVYRMASGSADVIRWLMGGRVLTAGTTQGEYAIGASSQQEALTPSNIRAVLQTTYGTSAVLPIRINQSVLYPQREGDPDNPSRKIREFSYEFSQDAFASTDVTIFAEHITGSGIEELAYAMAPDSLILSRRTDGRLALCTYERAQEVVAWCQWIMAGPDARVKALAVTPGTNGDEIWVSVERTIDGVPERHIEVFMPIFYDQTSVKEDGIFVDGSLTYSGASTTTITGLWHLRGADVDVLSNGNVTSGTVSAVGTLTLAEATTKAHIGYAVPLYIETSDIEAGAQAGTAQSRAKRVSDIWMRLIASLGGKVGTIGDERTDGAVPIVYRTDADPLDSSPPLKSGLVRVENQSGWERECRIQIAHTEPLPFHVTAIVAEISTSG